jgi:hypothetical protein
MLPLKNRSKRLFFTKICIYFFYKLKWLWSLFVLIFKGTSSRQYRLGVIHIDQAGILMANPGLWFRGPAGGNQLLVVRRRRLLAEKKKDIFTRATTKIFGAKNRARHACSSNPCLLSRNKPNHYSLKSMIIRALSCRTLLWLSIALPSVKWASPQNLKYMRAHGHDGQHSHDDHRLRQEREQRTSPPPLADGTGGSATGFNFVQRYQVEGLEETPLDEDDETKRVRWLPRSDSATGGLNVGEGRTTPVVTSNAIKLLGDAVSVPPETRRLLFDLGANKWETSLDWLLGQYPVRFDACYAWEMSRQLSPRLPSARAWKGRGNGFRLPGVMEVFNAKAAPQFAQCGDTGNCKKRELRRELRGCHDADLRHCRSFDVGRFILARARPEDYVVVKVDVEGFEYKLLDHWQALGVDRLIDEIFVEFHFATDNPKLTKSSWNERATRSYGKDRPMTKDNATAYFDRWRSLVPAFHAWP